MEGRHRTDEELRAMDVAAAADVEEPEGDETEDDLDMKSETDVEKDMQSQFQYQRHPEDDETRKNYAIDEKLDRDDSSDTDSTPRTYDEKITYEPIAEKSGLVRIETNKTTNTVASTTGESLKRIPTRNPNHRWYHYLLFKRKTLPPLPKERQVSREANASIISQMTWQWITPLMSVGYQRPLEPEDIWLVNPKRNAELMSSKLFENFERRAKRGSSRPLLGAMFETFKFEFVLGGACQLTSALIQVLNPFILRYLITFSEEAYYAVKNHTPSPDIGRGIGLVFAITILQTLQSQGTNQYIYRGMINGGQARASLISLIFDKSMRLSGRARAGGKAPSSIPVDLQPGSKEEAAYLKKQLKKNSGSEQDDASKGSEGWTNGRIVNLMSVDTYRVDQASGMFHMIWTAPIQLVLALILLLVNITYSALAGFGLIVLTTPLLYKAVTSLFHRRKAINKITDARVSLTQEILLSVRFVKYFGWETSFLERISNLRGREIRLIQYLMFLRNGINAISMSIPVFASMLAFITYAFSGHNLSPSYIFSSLALFNSLRVPLNLLPLVIGQVVDAASSIERIQEFLLAEEAKDEAIWDKGAADAINVEHSSFTWEQSSKPGSKTGGVDASKSRQQEKQERKAEKKRNKRKLKGSSTITTTKPAEAEDEAGVPFQLKDVNFSIRRNELVAVIGTVGSGKSSLLAALAGDMRRIAGNVTMGATRAFCPQYAWIQNATVQTNILFGKEMERDWYEEVIDACALRPDMEILPNGDMTEIGERGITVSGGQKQRLNIARAIYHDSDIILMDDPLSAVDAHVGRHIMDNAICGLMANKCRVLATHQLWVLSRCDRVIWMDDGKIRAFDTFANLMASDAEFEALIASNAQEEKEDEKKKGKAEHGGDEGEGEDKKKVEKKAKITKKGAALMQAEERAVNSVSWGVYHAYIKASGTMWFFPICLGLLILSQGANVVTSLWLSYWTGRKYDFSDGTYAGVYAALGTLQAALLFGFSAALSYWGTEASKTMLHRAITRCLRAPMSFFDTTPLGRITNRFSKDIDTMDNALTDAIRFFALTMAMIISVFILIIAYYYYFAIALGPLFIGFLFAASYYRASAREIKRHEAVLRSHVFARFSEAINGVATIRAYGVEKRFSKVIRDALDEMDAAYFLTYANQRWLSARLDAIGISLVFVVGILVVTSRFSVTPSTGGLVLSYILSIVQMLQFTIRQLAEVENDMNSTERIHYYGTQLDEEAPLHREPVPESWPEKGEIVFKDVEMRYRAGLPMILQKLNLHVSGGERIGVVGRTGAGKSSIMSTIFRLVELSGGSISIDGIDISTVGLHDLRSKLAIIPQDPTLFKGTVRSNLDPFGNHDDLSLWNALRQANLVQSTSMPGSAGSNATEGNGVLAPSEPTAAADDASEKAVQNRIQLDSTVEEEGLNFSLGQRQLMALARALVRNSQIIICDEATSSVDMETDAKIQRTIVEAFKGRTLLCIAHRLRTILQYDRIVVMDQGQIAEIDTPLNLWMQSQGIFRGMCDRSKITREDFEKSIDELVREEAEVVPDDVDEVDDE